MDTLYMQSAAQLWEYLDANIKMSDEDLHQRYYSPNLNYDEV